MDEMQVGLKLKLGLIAVALMLVGLVCYAKVQPSEVLWVDFDMKNIPEPKERPNGYYDYFFREQLIEGAKQAKPQNLRQVLI